MRTLILLLFLASGAVVGCAPGREAPAVPLRATCDELAAEAIATESLDEARRLATRAAECYEELQAQRR